MAGENGRVDFPRDAHMGGPGDLVRRVTDIRRKSGFARRTLHASKSGIALALRALSGDNEMESQPAAVSVRKPRQSPTVREFGPAV